MIQYNRMPDVSQPLNPKGTTAAGWFRFWQGLWSGTPTGPQSVIAVKSSPFSYVAPAGGSVLISGGTVSQIQYSRDGANFYVTGQTAGILPVSQGDTLVVTYSVPPTMVLFPR